MTENLSFTINEFICGQQIHYENQLEKEMSVFFDPAKIFIDTYKSKIELLKLCSYRRFNSIDDLSKFLKNINLVDIYVPENPSNKNLVFETLTSYSAEIINQLTKQ